MNAFQGVGRLTKDPELRYTATSNKPVCNFTIAINEGKDRVEFVPVVVFDDNATNCHKYLAKGSYAGVEGKFHVNKWKDNDGNNRERAEIIANRVEFLTSTSVEEPEQPQEPKVNNDSIEDDLPF